MGRGRRWWALAVGGLALAALRPQPLPALVPPVADGAVTSGYGWRGGRFHAGLDLEAAAGSPVRAAAGGVVRLVGEDPAGYGRYVVLDHGRGWETLYAHLAAVAVREGERVAAGQVIGRVGRSGNAAAPHLHLEVRRGGRARDPAPLLGLPPGR